MILDNSEFKSKKKLEGILFFNLVSIPYHFTGCFVISKFSNGLKGL